MTTTEVLIRHYRAGDHTAMIALNRYGLAAAGVPEDADVYAGDLDNLNTTYLVDRGALLVAECGGVVVAMGAIRPIDNTTCEITRMRVTPTAQGRGIGKAVLTALEQQARKIGYHTAVLLTGPDQHPAIDLYQASGYTVTATEIHGTLAGVRMIKTLTARR